METVLVVQNETYSTIADSTEINDMAEGSLVFLTPAGAVVPSTGFAGIDDPYFQMVLKTAGGGFLRSPLIERSTFAVVKEVYAAPVEKVQTLDFVGANVDGPTTAGVTIAPGVYVTPLYGKDYENFEVAIEDGESINAIAVKITAAINAGSDYVTATVSTTVITLTGKAGTPFTANGTFAFLTYASETTTDFSAGHGTYAVIADQEKVASAHKGNGRYKSFNEELYPQPMQAQPGVEYATWNFTWKKIKYDQLNANDAPYNQLGMIATADGNTLDGVLDAIFATV